MARVLIVGCGCRGRALGVALQDSGHIVRGTSRKQTNIEKAAATGIEAVSADPVQLSQIEPYIDGVAVVVWLMGSASGDQDSVSLLHDEVLAHLLRRLVDTQVRGFVYEPQGSVSQDLLAIGRGHVANANNTWKIPVAYIEAEPDDPERWHKDAQRAVLSLLQ